MHVSRDEQARRFIKRLDEPDKRWKFSMGDVRERERWPDYMKAYEDVVQKTSTPDAPWVVVPADRKWFARLVIAGAVLGALEQLQLARRRSRRVTNRSWRRCVKRSRASSAEDGRRQGGGRKRR